MELSWPETPLPFSWLQPLFASGSSWQTLFWDLHLITNRKDEYFNMYTKERHFSSLTGHAALVMVVKYLPSQHFFVRCQRSDHPTWFFLLYIHVVCKDGRCDQEV